MNWLRKKITHLIDSGVRSDALSSDARYIRFLNATLLLFSLAQLPVLILLTMTEMTTQLLVNLCAFSLFGLGYLLNRYGYSLPAKILVLMVMTGNTAYFALLVGSSAPTHFWLIPVAVLGVLIFKPSEWIWASFIVGLSILCFVLFELTYINIDPIVRPFTHPQEALKAAQGSTISSLILTLLLIGMMHRRFIQSETALSTEKAQSDRLLRAILPEEIAQELSETGAAPAVRHEDVSLLFADIVGFTPLAASMPAEKVVALLAEIFKRFDALIVECGVEKIKTIGDAYMVAGGVPQPSLDHAERLAQCACGMLEIMETFSAESGHQLKIRIGLHRGPAVAGVIGTTKFAYDLWGESVNLASRLESSGQPGRIHVSDSFRTALMTKMTFEERGLVDLKGVGPTQTYWLSDID